jgi:hypothetical protein
LRGLTTNVFPGETKHGLLAGIGAFDYYTFPAVSNGTVTILMAGPERYTDRVFPELPDRLSALEERLGRRHEKPNEHHQSRCPISNRVCYTEGSMVIKKELRLEARNGPVHIH